MATYAIGDVQGCFLELQQLVEKIRFDPANDRLWFVGDLVNRGPRSLDVLRFVKGLGNAAVSVLGNHELHLLSCAYGARQPKARDTFADVLEAADRDELVAWIAERPVLHREGDYILVHAGIHPTWSTDDALAYAREVEQPLREAPAATIRMLREREAAPQWHPGMSGPDRVRTIVAIFTRMRTCTEEGTLNMDFDGPPAQAPHGCRAWFEWPGRCAEEATVVFGHWAALGVHVDVHVIALDSACVWGGQLSALRLDDGRLFQQPALGRSR
jgi:bis(5'-nucleosyl)-tetraphosphatase (symmetrical)